MLTGKWVNLQKFNLYFYNYPMFGFVVTFCRVNSMCVTHFRLSSFLTQISEDDVKHNTFTNKDIAMSEGWWRTSVEKSKKQSIQISMQTYSYTDGLQWNLCMRQAVIAPGGKIPKQCNRTQFKGHARETQTLQRLWQQEYVRNWPENDVSVLLCTVLAENSLEMYVLWLLHSCRSSKAKCRMTGLKSKLSSQPCLIKLEVWVWHAHHSQTAHHPNSR